LKDGLKTIDNYADKGRWLIFACIFLLLIEFFSFITYFIQNAGSSFEVSGFQHLYFVGGFVYFFLLLFALFLAVRITSITKEMPHFFENYSFSWKRSLWDQKISDLEPEQKKRLTLLLIEKRGILEQNYSVTLTLVVSSVTLLLVVTARWLFTAIA